MDTQRLHRIAYLFPEAPSAARAFFDYLAQFLGELPGTTAGASGIGFAVTPPRGLPALSMALAAVAFPQVLFNTEAPIDLPLGAFALRSSAVAGDAETPPAPDSRPAPHRADAVGPYVEVGSPDAASAQLALTELARRLAGRLVRLDHTGVNIPTTRVDRAGWDALLHRLGGIANVYRYPTGEDWPFILPATDAEFADGITDFAAVREPKFELVYDSYAREPVIQISVETDLLRSDLEALLPAPYGVAFPDLGDIFRTVFVHPPWPGLQIRCDLYSRSAAPVDPWTSGEWLVTQGGRIGNGHPAG
ncbi:MAG TPA: hypothetical protein VF276_18135 [Chloroflexia bacterium]